MTELLQYCILLQLLKQLNLDFIQFIDRPTYLLGYNRSKIPSGPLAAVSLFACKSIDIKEYYEKLPS